jgi:hypothetical protein
MEKLDKIWQEMVYDARMVERRRLQLGDGFWKKRRVGW